MLKGVNLEAVKEVMSKTKMKVVAAGGITTIQDVENLKKINAMGCIVERPFMMVE